jgi:hypothetical protein
MRIVVLGLILSAVASPSFAQTILKTEPFILAPYEMALVQNAACGPGRVLRVTGALRGLNRKKVCVTFASRESASLATATP